MRIEELKDKPVMSVASGTKLGEVHDFLLDDSYLQIAALVIGGGGLFGGHKQAVAYSAIHGIGPDAVMVSDQSAVREVGDSSPLGKAHGFDALKQEVMSESGVNLGRVVEMEFEPQTGAVSGFCFAAREGDGTEGSDLCDVDRADIVSVTGTMVIVRHSVVAQKDDERTVDPAQDRGELVGGKDVRPPNGHASAGQAVAAGVEPSGS